MKNKKLNKREEDFLKLRHAKKTKKEIMEKLYFNSERTFRAFYQRLRMKLIK